MTYRKSLYDEIHGSCRSKLESALAAPRQTFGGELYPTFSKKAAVRYYGLVKDHPESTKDYLVSLAKRVADSKGNEQRMNSYKR